MATLRNTLRCHDHPVTIIDYAYIPNPYSKTNSLLTPTLVSGDEAGNIVWWNLSTKRAIIKWKAHEKNILSIKQLGLQWEMDSSKKNLVPKFGNFYGMLMTHSRDNTMKLWDLRRFLKDELKLRGLIEPELESLDAVYEEQINSLNFCNVDVVNDKVCCLNRINPEYFDIFEIKYDKSSRKYQIDQLFESIDPSILVKTDLLKKEILNDPEKKKLKKLGIIMRLLWINGTTLAIGFESGHVMLFKIPLNEKSLMYIDDSRIEELESILNVDDLKENFIKIAGGKTEAIAHLIYGDTTTKSNIEILSMNSQHYPNPILDIKLDINHEYLLSSSTGCQLLIIDLRKDQELIGFFDLKAIGISSIDVRLDDLITVTFWNGQVKFYKYPTNDGNKNIELNKLPFKITKSKSIAGKKEFSANPNDPEILGDKQLRRFKSNLVKSSLLQSKKSIEELIKSYKPKSVRDLMDYKRFLGNSMINWIAVGYEDGSIELHQLDQLE